MIARLALLDVGSALASFPAWWYGRGFSIVAGWARGSVARVSARLALGVWARNLFVPMYGETEWSGRAISFLVRAAMVVVRGAGVAAWTGVVVALVALYLAALPVAVIGTVFHGIGLLVS